MQLTSKQRAALFWGVCTPLRFYMARNGDGNPYVRTAAAVIAYRWLSGLEDAHEGAFGGVAFWADERPLHGALWGAYAVSGQSSFLYADVGVGMLNWIGHYVAK